MANQYFKKGSGHYRCQCCKQLTRDVHGDAVNVQLCEQCFDVGGEFNSVQDGYPDAYENLKELIAEAVRVRNCQNCAKQLEEAKAILERRYADEARSIARAEGRIE